MTCWWCGRVGQREWHLNRMPVQLCDLCVPAVLAEMRRRGLVVTLERTT